MLFVKWAPEGHALIECGKWEGHDFFRKTFLKYPGVIPPPHPQLKTYLPLIFLKPEKGTPFERTLPV